MYQREQTYRRAVKALNRVARLKKWDERSPRFALSDVRERTVVLRDLAGEIASFRITDRGLRLIDR